MGKVGKAKAGENLFARKEGHFAGVVRVIW